MKVKTIEDTLAFKPVTIQITFETQEELDIWLNMVTYDHTLPKEIYGEDSPKYGKLQKMLGKLQGVC
jgi:conjugal transfer/entry exclusion protein